MHNTWPFTRHTLLDPLQCILLHELFNFHLIQCSVMMEMYGYCWEKQVDNWRCALVRGGQQCAPMDGLMLMQLLHVGNQDMPVVRGIQYTTCLYNADLCEIVDVCICNSIMVKSLLLSHNYTQLISLYGGFIISKKMGHIKEYQNWKISGYT